MHTSVSGGERGAREVQEFARNVSFRCVMCESTGGSVTASREGRVEGHETPVESYSGDDSCGPGLVRHQ